MQIHLLIIYSYNFQTLLNGSGLIDLTSKYRSLLRDNTSLITEKFIKLVDVSLYNIFRSNDEPTGCCSGYEGHPHPYNFFSAEAGMSQNHVSSSSREFQAEAGKLNLLPSHLSIGVLQEIGRRCRSKVLIGSGLHHGCLASLFLWIIYHLLMCRWSSNLL